MAYFLDLMPILTEITLALENLNEWSSPKYVSGDSLVNAYDSCKITPQPLGVCLIIGTWNYPIQLALIPLASAIAAGNCAIVKPSEVAPKSAILLEFLLKKYLDTDSFAVVNGAVKETTVLLEQKFDHIFYTGNGSVGSIILKAASKNLTPVVLELGGKSPVYVDVDCDIKVIAKRIYWAKTINASQVFPNNLDLYRARLHSLSQGRSG